MSRAWKTEIRATLRLALPVVLGQIGMVTMGTVDIAFVGRHSEGALAAMALSHLYVFAVTMFAMGALHALDPLISQAIGAAEHRGLGTFVQRGLVLAGALTVPGVLFCLPAEGVLTLCGQPPDVIPEAARCVYATAPAVYPFLAFIVLRQTLQALSRTRPIVITVLAANLLNALLDALLVNGAFGLPAFGALGCAWATTACRFALAAGLLAAGWSELGSLVRPWRPAAARMAPMLRLLRLGAPIGAAHLAEYGAFMTTMLWMGNLGKAELASHQIAINLAALSFMVAMGLSNAAAVRVGYHVGAGDRDGTRRATGASLALVSVVMLLTACAFLFAPRALANLYTDQAAVLPIAASLIQLAGVFQLVDGLQGVACGVLRGMGDTRTAMVAHLIGFWLIGLPLGRTLGFAAGLGPSGLWWGLVAGLTVAAGILLWQVLRLLSRPIARLRLDSGESPGDLGPGIAPEVLPRDDAEQIRNQP